MAFQFFSALLLLPLFLVTPRSLAACFRSLCAICYRHRCTGCSSGGAYIYSVYDKWENTPYQRAEMLEYNGTATFEQCGGGFDRNLM